MNKQGADYVPMWADTERERLKLKKERSARERAAVMARKILIADRKKRKEAEEAARERERQEIARLKENDIYDLNLNSDGKYLF